MKKEFIKLSGMLFVITLVAALLLAGVNKLTEERILIAAEKASEESMQKLVPEAENFRPINETVFEGERKNKVAGYCVKVEPLGFAGKIEMMVGFSFEGELLGIDILQSTETAGLGAKADDAGFKNQFKGKSTDLTVQKSETNNENEIQAITGATITSRAVAEGVRMAAEELKKIKGGNI